MRPALSLILGLSLIAGAASAQTFQSWGDTENGGSRWTSGDPNAGLYQERTVTQQSSGWQSPAAFSGPPPMAPPPMAAPADGRGRVVEEETVIRQWGGSPPGQDLGPPQQAGPPPCGCGHGGYEVPTYGYASQNYGWPGQACCMGGGEIRVGYMDSAQSGGVGGVPWTGPMGGYYYGGWDRGWNSGWRGGGVVRPPVVRPPIVQPR